MKNCNTCEIKKPYSEFYKHLGAKDGLASKCKECTKIAVRANYRRNIEHYKQYEKQRASLPHRVEARLQYAQTEQGKERGAAAKQKWLLNLANSVKRAAHILVGNAVRDGRLFKPDCCSNCGVTGKRIHGHHDDYAKPLEVRWLCSKCHQDWHKTNKPLNI